MDQAKDLIVTAFLKENFPRIKDWTVGDIRKASRISKNGKTGRNGSLIGAYMLWCCAVEYFGGLLIGPNSTTKERIKNFVERYLNKQGGYNHKKIYDFFRFINRICNPVIYPVFPEMIAPDPFKIAI